MPQTVMDWWVIGGVIVALVGVFIAWRQFYGSSAKKTSNVVRGSKRITQSGGDGTTGNLAEDSSDVDQSG